MTEQTPTGYEIHSELSEHRRAALGYIMDAWEEALLDGIEPEMLANAALFLLSDLSEWITGQVLAVDGGASIKPSYLDADGLPAFVEDEAMRARLFGE